MLVVFCCLFGFVFALCTCLLRGFVLFCTRVLFVFGVQSVLKDLERLSKTVPREVVGVF